MMGAGHKRGRMDRAFRERTALAAHELHFGPNMTPMVDVVMVILIFFMASTALVGPEWFIRAHLPEDQAGIGGTAERFVLPEVQLEIRLTSDDEGVTRVRGFGLEAGTLDELEQQIEGSAADLLAGGAIAEPIVVVIPASTVPYQDVVRAHDACALAGFTRVGLR